MSTARVRLENLHGEILLQVCEELGSWDQFGTLFNCACACKWLARPALKTLYRFHHKAPVRGGGEDYHSLPPASKLLILQRWSLMWRSIIASALDATIFPYCDNIKVLDFRDFGNLLDEDQFLAEVSSQFFSGPLKQFEKTEICTEDNGKNCTRFKNADIIDAVGEVVTQRTPSLFLISGQLSSSALVRWAPRLPCLETLELWDGSSLENELVHASIHNHCPRFDSLMIYTWPNETSDHKLAKFLRALRPNSFVELRTISDIRAGAETFSALSQHGQKLQYLQLCISVDTAPFLNLLAGCTSLQHLQLDDFHGHVDLETTHNDVYLEVIAWLRKCEHLEQLVFPRLPSGAGIATPILLEHNIHLTHLEVDHYALRDHKAFHRALINQQASLKCLSLGGDTDDMYWDDLEMLLNAVKQLHQLENLKLYLPELLNDDHVMMMIENLKLLKELYVSALDLTDIVLDSIAKLPILQNVTLSGITKFTAEGLCQFISKLGTGHAGIRVTIDMVDPETMLSEGNVTIIRDYLAVKIGGTLEYMALRDPYVSEFESDSD